MGVSCCGEARSGRYCPQCGERLGGGPLVELLKHCRTTEAKLRTQETNRRESGEAYREEGDVRRATNCDGFAENTKARADKWAAWANALDDLMAGKIE